MSEEKIKPNWDNPSNSMMNSPEFNAVWDLIEDWTITIPDDKGKNEIQASGVHVKAILDCIKESRPSTVLEIVKKLKFKSLGNKTREDLIKKLDEMLNSTVI